MVSDILFLDVLQHRYSRARVPQSKQLEGKRYILAWEGGMKPLRRNHHVGKGRQMPGTLIPCNYRKTVSHSVLVSHVAKWADPASSPGGRRQSFPRRSAATARGPSPPPAGTLTLLAPRELGRRRLECVQQQERVLRGLVHVAEGAAAHVPMQWRGESKRRHLSFSAPRARTQSAHA